MAELNEALFSVPGLLDFGASLGHDGAAEFLELSLGLEQDGLPGAFESAQAAVRALLASKNSRAEVRVRPLHLKGSPLANLGKRTLTVINEVVPECCTF